MQEEVPTNGKDALPESKRLYFVFVFAYVLWSASAVYNLRSTSYVYHPIWRWTMWLDIAIDGYCAWLFFDFFSTLSNGVEKVICFLSMIAFVLAIPKSLHTLGYHWARIPAINWTHAGLAIVAASLMCFRTSQVFSKSRNVSG